MHWMRLRSAKQFKNSLSIELLVLPVAQSIPFKLKSPTIINLRSIFYGIALLELLRFQSSLRYSTLFQRALISASVGVLWRFKCETLTSDT